jgi:hypothetical protein
MNKLSIYITLSSVLLLTACGGGGGGSGGDTFESGSSTNSSATGKVIDGYISGATVFLDLNFNNTLDTGEPNTVSIDAGDYRLELTEDNRRCLQYAPIVVDVPVGAIDEEQGEITEAYQMVLPPTLEPIADSAKFNISPLTSVVWSSIESELNVTRGKSDLSCGNFLNQKAEPDRLKNLLQNAIDKAVAHYNVSEEQLFSDFVANNDAETQTKAIAIVKGLKKSLAETAKLIEQHPDALYVQANYYQFDSRDADARYPDAWYRESYIFYGDSSTFSLDKVSDDLSTISRTIIYGETDRIEKAEFSYSESFEFESRNGDSSPYSCDIKEIVETTQNGKRYELVNLISQSASTFEDCTVVNFDSDSYMRYATVSQSINATFYTSQFSFRRTVNGFPDLNDWLGLKPKLDELNINLMTSSLEGLPYGYAEIGDGGADWWVKTKIYTEGDDEIRLWKDNSGNFRKVTTFLDGTSKLECSVDGSTWGTCS